MVPIMNKKILIKDVDTRLGTSITRLSSFCYNHLN